jgi:hypothetical protein
VIDVAHTAVHPRIRSTWPELITVWEQRLDEVNGRCAGAPAHMASLVAHRSSRRVGLARSRRPKL